MNGTDYELVKRWLDSDEEEVNLHGIHWLRNYYEENYEAKEDRIVDLLLSQLDRELNKPWTQTLKDDEGEPVFRSVLGRYYLRLCAVKMLEENTRPYEGRIASKIVRVAQEGIGQPVEDEDADELVLTVAAESTDKAAFDTLIICSIE